MIYSLLVLALLGYGGFFVYFYNRVNATGLPRRLTKTLSYGMLLLGLLGGLVVASVFCQWIASSDLWTGGVSIASLGAAPLILRGWIATSATLGVILGIPWLLARPCWGRDAVPCLERVRVIQAVEVIGHSPARTPRCRFHAAIPLNQIFELAAEEKQLPIPGLPDALEGFRIAHLSDLHLTGQVGPEFHALAADIAARWQPQAVMLSGDIIDNAACIGWLEEVLRPFVCPYGKFFVLGNHDKKVADPNRVRTEMQRLGWTDLGGRAELQNWLDVPVELFGSEVPWFGASPPASIRNASEKQKAFRLLLSHSPDQIVWARRNAIDLMLAGHTHGGQGRLPLLGPVLSPSRFGSRFASGTFFLSPTTMHVTRGLSGTHLLRINCRPEVSLLVLRNGPLRDQGSNP